MCSPNGLKSTRNARMGFGCFQRPAPSPAPRWPLPDLILSLFGFLVTATFTSIIYFVVIYHQWAHCTHIMGFLTSGSLPYPTLSMED